MHVLCRLQRRIHLATMLGAFAAAAALVTTGACRPTATPSPVPSATPPAPSAVPPAAAATYIRFCAVCHGKDGKAMTGTFSPQLNNPTFLASASDAFLVESIASGRPGTKMSAFGGGHGGPLSEAQILLIVAHLRQWPTEGLPTPEPATVKGYAVLGRLVYDAKCLVCHGAAGLSEQAPDLANPELQTVADDAFLRYAMLHGRPGTLMVPANLSEQQMADVIAYIRTWRRQ